MKVQSFGLVSVYSEEPNVLHDDYMLAINWSCVGLSDLDTAEKLQSDLSDAISFYKKLRDEVRSRNIEINS